jgi:hypothetical protein
VRISVNHTNNSNDREITAIYDRSVRLQAVSRRNQTAAFRGGTNVNATISTTNVVRYDDFWPGRLKALGYTFPLMGRSLWGWNRDAEPARIREVNEGVARMRGNDREKALALFENIRVNYDFHVRSSSSN